MSGDNAPTPLQGLETWFHPDAPWEMGFISFMRMLTARSAPLPIPGSAALPSQETFRLGQIPHMIFPPREIAQADLREGKVDLQLFGLGIWGPQGAMPLHLTEKAYDQAKLQDHGLIDLINLFHHRALSKFYFAWLLTQDTASLDRPNDDKFSFYVGNLTGIDSRKYDVDNIMPLYPRLAASAHLIREARNPEGLIGIIHYYFEIPVSIKEFAYHWIKLEPRDQTQLGQMSGATFLGSGAILGDTVIDRQHKFELILGPLTFKQYLHFSPWGDHLPLLREWVRSYVGFEFAWEVSLYLKADEVPLATLAEDFQLGYTTWLAREDVKKPVAGISFNPENESGMS